MALVLLAWPAFAQPAPHFPHEPRFGGLFSTAAGDALHLEGVWAAQRRFKLLVLDSSGAPLAIERLRTMHGQVRAGARDVPLVLLEADGYFEARIPTLTLPATIEVAFEAATPASVDHLTFTFADYSIDTSGDATQAPIEIPATLDGIVAGLRTDQRAAQELVDRGELAALTESEHRIRELVLALQPHVAVMPATARRRAEAARVAAIRGAWLLHIAFDYGNEAQTRTAFARLSTAIDETLAAITSPAP